MWVYGDHDRSAATRAELARLHARVAALAEAQPGLAWHGRCVALFIAAAGLLQGLADAEFERAGHDAPTDAQGSLMNGLRTLAHAIERSWSSGFAEQRLAGPVLPALSSANDWPQQVTIRRPEGYAFYALYPELFLTAARAIPHGAVVVGLRSIGTGLAALVAAVCESALVLTLRPVAEVFARTVRIGPALEAEIRQLRDRHFVIVDEGPGLSGSSFGGTADALERLGVPRERIVFMPSHAGDLGPRAAPEHRARWNASVRPTASFESTLLDATSPAPLSRWFEDITGPAQAPLRDLSGGTWRALSPTPDAPADPGREARKYLLAGTRGTFLLKFVGLDDAAAGKVERARQLHQAGFSPEPLACRYGFMLERWVEALPHIAEHAPGVEHIGRYLAFRAAHFPAPATGAPLSQLVEMARFNIGQADGALAGSLAARWTEARLAKLQHHVRPVFVDARLHRWEWLRTPGGWLKSDAVDHAQAHDLIGCQDIAWDVAGAAVEFDLTPDERDTLIANAMGDRPEAAELVACMTLCYLGFQIGWWSYGADGASAEHQRRFYRSALEAAMRAR